MIDNQAEKEQIMLCYINKKTSHILYEIPFLCNFSLSHQGSFNRSKLVINFFCIFIHIA
jgi:hypothetical protein